MKYQAKGIPADFEDKDNVLYTLNLDEYDGLYVYGNLLHYDGKPYITGDLVEVDAEYTSLAYWIPVLAESVIMT
jgi:hypothetical protein